MVREHFRGHVRFLDSFFFTKMFTALHKITICNCYHAHATRSQRSADKVKQYSTVTDCKSSFPFTSPSFSSYFPPFFPPHLPPSLHTSSSLHTSLPPSHHTSLLPSTPLLPFTSPSLLDLLMYLPKGIFISVGKGVRISSLIQPFSVHFDTHYFLSADNALALN